MRGAMLLQLAVGLAASSPVHKRQTMDFAEMTNDLADELANLKPADQGPVDPIVQATAVSEERDICTQTFTGAGPTVTASPTEWASHPSLTQPALAATAPAGYDSASNFKNLQGLVQQMGYLTVRTLDSYSPDKCADYCNNEPLCMAFNIYFERDPSTDPVCTPDHNPPSTTTIGCTLYAYHITATKATNTGQWRETFQVLIAGSNGYNKHSTKLSYPLIPGFKSPPQDFGTAAINAPLYKSFDSYLTYTAYAEPGYDPRICAAACTAQTQRGREEAGGGRYKACNYFVAYVLARNDEPQGLVCAMYALPWNATYAVNSGYYDGNDQYTVYNSLAYIVEGELDFGGNDEISGFVYTGI